MGEILDRIVREVLFEIALLKKSEGASYTYLYADIWWNAISNRNNSKYKGPRVILEQIK